MNPRDKYHNVDKQHKHYEHSWYSQQHRTQSYNENIADLTLSIIDLIYYQIADLTL